MNLVRGIQAAWNAGRRDGTVEFFHPDVEFVPRRAATEGAYSGLAGIEKFLADTDEVFDKFELNAEFEDLGDAVLGWGTIRVRAKGDGPEIEFPTGGLFHFRDGKVLRWEDFGSREAALEAASR